jgi:hypothetical protein
MALRVQLACWHLLWPRGDASLYKNGEEVYCESCQKRRVITEVGDVPC